MDICKLRRPDSARGTWKTWRSCCCCSRGIDLRSHYRSLRTASRLARGSGVRNKEDPAARRSLRWRKVTCRNGKRSIPCGISPSNGRRHWIPIFDTRRWCSDILYMCLCSRPPSGCVLVHVEKRAVLDDHPQHWTAVAVGNRNHLAGAQERRWLTLQVTA